MTRAGVAVFALLLPAVSAAAAPTFEVGGTLEPASEGLRVRVTLRNAGDQAAEGLTVEGELLGDRARADVGAAIAPRATRDALLVLPEAEPQPGVHALVLRLDYVAAGASQWPLNQWAYLLLAFGGSTSPAIRVEAAPASFGVTGQVPVTLESVDGRPHRVQLSIFSPRGVTALPSRQTVEVPASRRATAEVRVFRSLAADGSRHGLLAVATTLDEDSVRTSAATTTVDILPNVGLVARLRVVLVAAAVLLAAWSVHAPARPPEDASGGARPC